jgi:hypothetical protein
VSHFVQCCARAGATGKACISRYATIGNARVCSTTARVRAWINTSCPATLPASGCAASRVLPIVSEHWRSSGRGSSSATGSGRRLCPFVLLSVAPCRNFAPVIGSLRPAGTSTVLNEKCPLHRVSAISTSAPITPSSPRAASPK